MDTEEFRHFYREGEPRYGQDGRPRLNSNATVVLWDGNTGEPFYMPPGGSIMKYLSRGFKANPPEGWAPSTDRPVIAPTVKTSNEAWTPKRVKSDLQLEYERKYAEMKAKEAEEEALQESYKTQNERLASALEKMAGTEKPKRTKQKASV